MKGSLFQVIRRPLVTEKTNDQRDELNQYVFEVATDANKVEIRRAVESAFEVRVVDVRTSIVRGKQKRTRKGVGYAPNWKKAVVTLHPEDTIEIFEGV